MVPHDVALILRYALYSHPQGLDPEGWVYDMDLDKSSATLYWATHTLGFHWVLDEVWIDRYLPDGTTLKTDPATIWHMPLTPLAHTQFRALLDDTYQTVLDSPA